VSCVDLFSLIPPAAIGAPIGRVGASIGRVIVMATATGTGITEDAALTGVSGSHRRVWGGG
jgi:hypothetical protein